MTTAPTTFGWRRAWLVKAIVGGAIGGVAAGAMGLAIAVRGFGDFGPDRRILFSALFLTFGILLTTMAATYLRELLGGKAIVWMGAEGLEDRRISARPLPWSAIRGLLPVQNGMQLMLALDVADPASVVPPRNPVWRLNRWCARRLGYPELVIRVTGLDADLFTIMAAIGEARAAA